MKRVLIFSLAYYPHVGGAEVAIKEVTDRVRDIEFHLVTQRFSPADAREEEIGNVRVHRIGNGPGKLSKFFYQFGAARKGRQLHQQQPFDAVWAMMAHSAGVPAALFKMSHPDVPYILSLQEGDPIPHIERTMLPLWPLFTRAFTKATIILPLSNYLARWARTRHFRGPIEIMPNGVSVNDFSGAPIPHDDTILITTSRLVRKNAVDDVIKALPLLPSTVRFQILGSGPEEEFLKALVHTCGVETRVEFLGHIDRARMPDYLHRADIFIRPSRSEGFGISFMEAMAAGLPVIATQEGGIADFLFDTKRNPDKMPTGWAVDKDSPEQIVEAVKEIIANPDAVARVQVNALALVREKYDWNLIAKRMRDVFDHIKLFRMKLVIATPLYPPEIGGPATYAKVLEDGLPGKDIEVELVKFSDVRHLPKVVRHYVYYRRVLKAARNADVVLALDPVSVGLPAMKAARKARKPFVVKIVGDYAWEQGRQRFGITQTLDEFVATKKVPLPVRVLRRIQTRVALRAERIIVPSNYLKDIVTAWGIPAHKIEVIYNAMPHEAPGAVPKSVKNLSRPLVVTAGRLVPWKHMDGVIDAVAQTSPVALAIIGDGPERDVLARRANEKLSDRAVLTGLLSHRDTLAVVKSADVFVLNSSYEGLSHHLIEALMLGVPTIATDVGGNPEVITDGIDGLLVPVGDTPALAHALARVLGDDELRALLSERAKESAKRFSVDTLLSATATVLKHL